MRRLSAQSDSSTVVAGHVDEKPGPTRSGKSLAARSKQRSVAPCRVEQETDAQCAGSLPERVCFIGVVSGFVPEDTEAEEARALRLTSGKVAVVPFSEVNEDSDPAVARALAVNSLAGVPIVPTEVECEAEGRGKAQVGAGAGGPQVITAGVEGHEGVQGVDIGSTAADQEWPEGSLELDDCPSRLRELFCGTAQSRQLRVEAL
jgi:hypothetical protein